VKSLTTTSNQKLISTDERKSQYAEAAKAAIGETDALTGGADEVQIDSPSIAPTNGDGAGPPNEPELDAEPGDEAFAAANSAPLSVSGGNGTPELTVVNGGAGDGKPTFTNIDGRASVFDVAAMKAEFTGLTTATPVLASVKVGRPGKHAFFRIHRDDNMAVPARVIVYGEGKDQQTYYVTPAMRSALEGEYAEVLIVVGSTRQGQVFLWPLKTDLTNDWNQSAWNTAQIARSRWVRLRSNQTKGCYEPMVAEGSALTEPEWPKETLQELLTVGFGDRVISDTSHHVYRKLKGLE
jgi:hypothetical protein